MVDFEAFISDIISGADAAPVYDPPDISLTRAVLLSGHNPCNITNATSATRKYLLIMYFLLACHTQGVEAKLVSPTGQHKPLRLTYAIIRLHLEDELIFRGVSFVSDITFNKLKKLLSEHEVKRVLTDGNEQDITAAKKSFQHYICWS